MVEKLRHLLWLSYLMILVCAVGCGSSQDSPSDQTKALLTIEAKPTTLGAGEYSTITATLKNLAGTPIFGYPVVFSTTQNQSGSSITIVNNTTDIKGNASAIYKSGALAGIDIIEASCANVNPISVPIYVTPKTTPTPTPKTTPSPTPKSAPTPTPTG
jgi:hypothetical protein